MFVFQPQFLPPPTAFLADYASALYQRRAEGVLVKRQDVSIGTWRPLANQCHDNVSHWVEHHPTHRKRLGWLYFDLVNMMPFVRFTAHSVVELNDGTLIDITPTDRQTVYPFIDALLPEADFHAAVTALIASHDTAHLDHLKA